MILLLLGFIVVALIVCLGFILRINFCDASDLVDLIIVVLFVSDLVYLSLGALGLISIGTALANSTKFRGIGPRMCIEDPL